MALPLLPEHDIVEAWNELKTMPVPDVPAQPFRKFKSYITKTWIEQRLNVLSVYGQVNEIILIYWQLVANQSCTFLTAFSHQQQCGVI